MGSPEGVGDEVDGELPVQGVPGAGGAVEDCSVPQRFVLDEPLLARLGELAESAGALMRGTVPAVVKWKGVLMRCSVEFDVGGGFSVCFSPISEWPDGRDPSFFCIPPKLGEPLCLCRIDLPAGLVPLSPEEADSVADFLRTYEIVPSDSPAYPHIDLVIF